MSLLQDEYRDWCRPVKPLSKRDLEIAKLYAKGIKIVHIADALCLTNQAISNRLVRNIYPYFGVKGNRAQRREQMARKLGVNSG